MEPNAQPNSSILMEQVNPMQLLRAVIDRLWILVSIVIVAVLLGLAYLKWETPLYTSEALLEIPAQADQVIAFQDVLGDDFHASDIMRTLERTLSRSTILERVIESEDIREMPGLTAPLKNTSPSPGQLLSAFQDWTSIRHIPGTRLLSVSVTHPNSQIARDLANAIPQTYIRERLRLQSDTSESAFQFLLEEAERLRAKLQRSEDALQDFSKAVEIKEQISQQEKIVAELSQRYLSKHPRMIEAENLLDQLQDRFRRELLNTRTRIGDSERFWGNALEQLDGLTGQERMDEELKLLESRFNVLSRELESDRALYDVIVTRMKETDVTSDVQKTPFRIAEPARTPMHPSWPKMWIVLLLALILGGVLGLALIFGLELADSSINTVEDAEERLALPVLATVPALHSRKSRAAGDLILLTDPGCPGAEAYRTLRASLKLLGRSETRKSFVVTSSVPGEGKSMVASNLALAFAQDGYSTLLVDTDLRRNRIAGLFGLNNPERGIVNFLTDTCSLDSCCLKSDEEYLSLLPVNQNVPRPAELLDSDAFQELVRRAEEQYDKVVFDTPPVNAVADPLLVAQHCPTVIFVYKAHATPRGAALHALRQLQRIDRTPAGLVINQIKLNPRSGANRYYYHYTSGDGYGNAYGAGR